MIKVVLEKIFIPTYEIGEPDKNPMFLEKRVYQASKGKVYPYPIIEKIYDEKIEKEYNVIFLENDYIKLMLMPELGGRIQYGYDKINDYYFFYNNEVIKPALVGLCGPWISGGVEFNWPQHHRPSTFNPVEYSIEEDDDYITVWMGEIEQMSQMTGRIGVKIYNDKALVEVLGKSTNSTQVPQNFLWWANIAVHVHEEYESFFPVDVTYVADHGKRDITAYPFANSIYYNINYDELPLEKRNITNYKNIPVPMSYMAIGSKYNFFGGYDFKKKMGTLHVSNTNTAPGKKQWTWGNGEFGYAWDRHLTDKNGPYIELMAGVYTDNQPDFTWIHPGETKEFKQIWYPFSKLGKVKNASEDCAIKFDINENINFGIYAVKTINGTIKVYDDKIIVYSKDIELRCGEVFTDEIPNKNYKNLRIEILEKNKILLDFKIEENVNKEFKPYEEVLQPEAISSSDELYQIGIHLEQYRHATYDPEKYYLEALKRDEFDIRCNNAMGVLSYKRGEFLRALSYFENANKRQTKYNPNPINCDSFYGIGLCHKYLENYEAAYKAFYKSIWDFKNKSNGYLELVKLDIREKNYEKAFEHLNETLKYNSVNADAIYLREYCLEKANKKYNYKNVLEVNPLHYISLLEINGLGNVLEQIKFEYKTIIEIITLYYEINDIEKIIKILEKTQNLKHPILKMIGNILNKKMDFVPNLDYIFPHRIFERYILEKTDDSFEKNYLLGNLLYDKKEYLKAIENFEKAYKFNPNYSVLNRNLGIAYYNIEKNPEKALKFYELAYIANKNDSKLIFEIDALKKLLNVTQEERLKFIEKNTFALERDDLYLEYIRLQNEIGKYEEALELLNKRKFHPFEGGEGKVIEQFRFANIQLGIKSLNNNENQKAIKYFMDSVSYPENLGEGKIYGTPESDVNYYLGLSYENVDKEKSNYYYLKSINESVISSSNLSYKPEKLQMNYYQAMAHKRIGNSKECEVICENLIKVAKEKSEKESKIHYFAISVPELLIFEQDLNIVNKTLCYYLIGLGYLGLDNQDESKKYFEMSLELDIDNFEARAMQIQLKNIC